MLPLKSFQPMRLLSDTQVYPLLFLFFAFVLHLVVLFIICCPSIFVKTISLKIPNAKISVRKTRRRFFAYIRVRENKIGCFGSQPERSKFSMNAFEVTQAVTLTANYIAQNCAPEQVAVLAAFFTQLGDTLTTIDVVNEVCEIQNKQCLQRTK